MKFIKYDGRSFRDGQIIKLAGRKGTINHFQGTDHYASIKWSDSYIPDLLDLDKFPDLEIGIEEPTISKEAAETIRKYFLEIKDQGFSNCCEYPSDHLYHHLADKLESMVKKH